MVVNNVQHKVVNNVKSNSIAEMTTSAVTNRVKGGQIKRGGKERTHGHK